MNKKKQGHKFQLSAAAPTRGLETLHVTWRGEEVPPDEDEDDAERHGEEEHPRIHHPGHHHDAQNGETTLQPEAVTPYTPSLHITTGLGSPAWS